MQLSCATVLYVTTQSIWCGATEITCTATAGTAIKPYSKMLSIMAFWSQLAFVGVCWVGDHEMASQIYAIRPLLVCDLLVADGCCNHNSCARVCVHRLLVYWDFDGDHTLSS